MRVYQSARALAIFGETTFFTDSFVKYLFKKCIMLQLYLLMWAYGVTTKGSTTKVKLITELVVC